VSTVTSAVQRTIGRFEILGEIGRGATAIVYLARQTDLDRRVALKELSAFRAADPSVVERFLREARLAGSLNHPNIVTVYEYFEHDGTALIAMEYLESGSLRPQLPSLSVSRGVRVLEEVLAGLAHAHARGIVHRDLKPENVLVTSSGDVKISDFGIAKALELEAGDPLTVTGTTVGTPAYMAPEQATAGEVGPWTDLYAAGVLAYEMLAGEVPFHGSDVAMAILLQHLNEPVPPLRSVKPELDPALADWVERLLAKEPGGRPASAVEAADELEEIAIRVLGPRWRRRSRLADTGRPAAVTPSPGTGDTTPQAVRTRPLPHRAPRRRRYLVAALIAGVALVGIAAGVAATYLSSDERDAGGASETTTERETARTTTEASPPAPVLSGIRLTSAADPVTAALRFGQGALAPGVVHVRDREIADGRAAFTIRSDGIESRTRGGTFGPLSVKVREANGLLVVEVTATPKAFESFRARRVDGHRVALELARRTTPMIQPEPPPQDTTSSTTTTTTTTTEPPPANEPPPPPIKTG